MTRVPRNVALGLIGIWDAMRLRLGLVGAAMLVAGLVGCASPPKPEPEPAYPWQRSAQRLLDSVLAQGLAERVPQGIRDATQSQALAIKPSMDDSMRREGAGGPGLVSFLAQRVDQKHPRFARAETGTVDPGPGRWELRSSLTALDPAAGLGTSAYILSLELFDPVRGRVLASGRDRFVDPSLDMMRAPKPVVKPAPAPPPPAAPSVETTKPTAERLQALNAEYLSMIRQGRESDAQVALSRLVAESLAARSLSLRFLFGSSSADFLQDAVLIRRYDTWLAEVARQLRESAQCLQMVGHASRGGSDATNRRISLARAEKVKQVLLKHSPELAPRLFTVGVGAAQPMAGSGVNDPGDAVDRRVELRVIDCP